MVLVDIYVPAVDKRYDFQLDEKVPIHVIIEEITEMIGQKERMTVAGDIGGMILSDQVRGIILPKDRTLHGCGIGNGSRLLLV